MDTITEEMLLSDNKLDTIHEERHLTDKTATVIDEMFSDVEDGVDMERRGFSIKIISLENMEPMKKIIIKVELNEKLLGQSDEIFVQDKEVEINWEIFHEITEMTEDLLDELITHPLVFTVCCQSTSEIEEEPIGTKKSIKGKKEKGKSSKSPSEKEKSVKEHSISNKSKTTKKSASSKMVPSKSDTEVFPTLGVGNIDIIPLLLGQGEVKEELLLSPTVEQKGSDTIAWANLPKLKVLISTAGNISDGVSKRVSNVLFFTLESLHNIDPDCNEDVEVATILPNNKIVTFKHGTLLLDDSVWFSKRKAWSELRDIAGQGALSQYKVAENIFNLLNTMDYKVTDNSLSCKPRIQWNQIHRSLLSEESNNILKNKIVQFNCWPVEILIPSSSSKSEGKKKGEKVNETKSHYITFLDLSRLIYPGEKTVRVTSQLYTYTEKAMKTRFGSSHTLFEENTTPPDIQESKSSSKKDAKPEGTKSKKGSMKSKDGKKKVVENFEEVTEEEPEVPKEPETLCNEEGEPIFIVFEVELLKNLVRKRDKKKVLESIHKLIPEREALSTRQLETVNANKIYEECIKNLVHTIHEEYQIFFNLNETFKNSCKNFLMHLHLTGAYAKMVESMREALAVHVENIVSPGHNWGRMRYECQNVLTNLYHEMATKMYTIVLSLSDPSIEKYEPHVTYENLQFFESEAMEEGDYDKAHYYLLKRLEKSEKGHPQVWIDFSAFWKRSLEFEKAEECAKEAISLDPRHENALLFHGLLSWLTEDLDVAEMFLLAVATFHPRCLEGWVTLHMLHKQMGKTREANVELLNAKDCLNEHVQEVEGKANLYWSAGLAEDDRIFLLTAVKLISLSFPEFAELALSYDLLLYGRTVGYLYYLAVCHYQQSRYANSLVHLEEASKLSWENDKLWALKGHNLYKLEKLEEAKNTYQVTLSFEEGEDHHLIYLRLGNILMCEEDHTSARECYTVVCRDSPTPLTWLGLGISAFVNDDLEEAELALSEANMLDCKMGKVWGYLAVVNLMLDRPLVFNKCIIQAFKYGFEDQALMERINNLVKLVQPVTG